MSLTRINDVFEKVLVLNLDRRPERLAAVGAELHRFGIEFERFPAIDGQRPEVTAEWQAYQRRPLVRPPAAGRPVTSYREFYLDYDSQPARVAFLEEMHRKKALSTAGAWGLFRSMQAIVERALEAGWRSLLVLEDDVRLHRQTPELFDRLVAQLPPDWVVLQLGAMQLHWEPDWITWHAANLYRCHGSSIGAHAYGLRREALPLLRDFSDPPDLPFDIGPLHRIKREFAEHCFTAFPNIAIQDAADSDIGMSTMFFREARKIDNVYRWHLPDYGRPAIERPLPVDDPGRPPGPTARASAAGEDKTAMPSVISRQLTRITARLKPRRRKSRQAPATAASNGTPRQPTSADRGGAKGPVPLRAFPNQRPNARTIVAVVVGLDHDQVEQIVAMVDAQGHRLGMVPVVVTDSDRFEAFRGRVAVIEYVPPADQQARFAPELDWELYRLRRLALLRRKWQPARIVAFGPDATELVRRWGASPFEDAEIAKLIGRAPPTTTGEPPAAADSLGARST